MRTRAAAGLLLVAAAAGFAGHLAGAHAVAVRPTQPPPQILSEPLPPELAAPPAHGSHILWIFIQGRWRAVPS